MKNLNFAKNVLARRVVFRQSTEEMVRLAKDSNYRISFANRVLKNRSIIRETTEEMIRNAKRVSSNMNYLAKVV